MIAACRRDGGRTVCRIVGAKELGWVDGAGDVATAVVATGTCDAAETIVALL